jgi:hypothetical protein
VAITARRHQTATTGTARLDSSRPELIDSITPGTLSTAQHHATRSHPNRVVSSVNRALPCRRTAAVAAGISRWGEERSARSSRCMLSWPSREKCARVERVDMLFAVRGHLVAKSYINRTIIPALRANAGVPQIDVRGNITRHRARSTIASQLYNAKEPMTLLDLQAWLGHRDPATTSTTRRSARTPCPRPTPRPAIRPQRALAVTT